MRDKNVTFQPVSGCWHSQPSSAWYICMHDTCVSVCTKYIAPLVLVQNRHFLCKTKAG